MKKRLFEMPCDLVEPNTFIGFKMYQTYSTLYAFEEFIKAHPDVRVVVELGTGPGGLTLFLGLLMQINAGHVLTIDNDPTHKKLSWYPIAKNIGNIQWLHENAFDPITLRKVKAYINENIIDGKALILCDDGYKPRELRDYMILLEPGDFIMVHDHMKEILPRHYTQYIDQGLLELVDFPAFEELGTTWICFKKK